MKAINRPSPIAGVLTALFFLLLAVGRLEPAQAGRLQPVHPEADSLHIPYEVNSEGVLVNTDTGEEAAFFGVNYSPPFAHAYRAIERLGRDHRKAIDNDIYHFARMGFDGYRLHVWDTEISDSLGNLVENEHLELLDYMLWKLKERDIKIILTPLTFYDNGYPEEPSPTDGFANYISKEEAPLNKDYRPVIKRYLTQFINHVNPYTGLSYKEDPDIIATEVINEPTHNAENKQELQAITGFINELKEHLEKQGWEKPVFYNIAQNPDVAQAVLDADVDGTTFQWYPADLVGGETIQKDYLPYIDRYAIPFARDERFTSKAQMVYEFDSADLLGSYAYPAMARSFREAGFQWATQFAYDPMAFAYANSDYQTHYLNLAYTPSKAISMKIAAEVFRSVPRHQSVGRYPQNRSFENFRVSHEEDLSEMNSDTAFYYSNATDTKPKSPKDLRHVAGVGSSPVVQYEGTGAYFLDRLEEGVWRLEVMPDAIQVRDVYEIPSLDKHVVWIEWNRHPMQINLPDLGKEFSLRKLNDSKTGSFDSAENESSGHGILISPGTYLLVREGADAAQWSGDSRMGNIRLGEFVAPPESPREIDALDQQENSADSYAAANRSLHPASDEERDRKKQVDTTELRMKPAVYHRPQESISAGKSITISAKVAGLAPTDSVWLTQGQGWDFVQRPMHRVATGRYEVKVPGGELNSGLFSYRITVEGEDRVVTFPGGNPGTPADWDYYYDDTWKVSVVDAASPLILFDAKYDYNEIEYGFMPWEDTYNQQLKSGHTPGKMAVKFSAQKAGEAQKSKTDISGQASSNQGEAGWPEGHIGDRYDGPAIAWGVETTGKFYGRKPDIDGVDYLAVKAKSGEGKAPLNVLLVGRKGSVYRASIDLTGKWATHRIALEELHPERRFMLLPRPYPTFLPFWFEGAESSRPGSLNLKHIDQVQLYMEHDSAGPISFQVEGVWLE